MATKEDLKSLLRKLSAEGESAAVEEEAAQFLRDVDPQMLSLAEQELMQEGVGQDELRSLCDIHLKVLGGALEEQRPRTADEHPIGVMTAEHQVILRNLARLREIVERATATSDYAAIAGDLADLRTIAQLLLDTEPHHQREEKSLFPRLEDRGVTGPPRIMRLEHEDLRARKKRLATLAADPRRLPYPAFLAELTDAGGYLVDALGDHIFKEDNILYPTALQTLDPAEWAQVGAECDAIGYCSFTPGKSRAAA